MRFLPHSTVATQQPFEVGEVFESHAGVGHRRAPGKPLLLFLLGRQEAFCQGEKLVGGAVLWFCLWALAPNLAIPSKLAAAEKREVTLGLSGHMWSWDTLTVPLLSVTAGGKRWPWELGTPPGAYLSARPRTL